MRRPVKLPEDRKFFPSSSSSSSRIGNPTRSIHHSHFRRCRRRADDYEVRGFWAQLMMGICARRKKYQTSAFAEGEGEGLGGGWRDCDVVV